MFYSILWERKPNTFPYSEFFIRLFVQSFVGIKIFPCNMSFQWSSIFWWNVSLKKKLPLIVTDPTNSSLCASIIPVKWVKNIGDTILNLCWIKLDFYNSFHTYNLIGVVDKTVWKLFCLISLTLEDTPLIFLMEVLWEILKSWGLPPLVYERTFFI